MIGPQEEQPARELLCEMLRLFYDKGWVSGTGGGICAMGPRGLLVAPTGVHKERVAPADFFVVAVDGSAVTASPPGSGLAPSECTSIFCAIVRRRGAGSVVHSHALSPVLAADAAGKKPLTIEGLEMLKGIAGVSNTDLHVVPVIANTQHEAQLTDEVERVLGEPDFAAAHAILVRDHGAYIWGADVWEAKRHAETYHFLFEAVVARRL